tara:strand:- start:1022 stop:1303 length:282 start_codon:yes stop_codon:yes gene_type:complete
MLRRIDDYPTKQTTKTRQTNTMKNKPKLRIENYQTKKGDWRIRIVYASNGKVWNHQYNEKRSADKAIQALMNNAMHAEVVDIPRANAKEHLPR